MRRSPARARRWRVSPRRRARDHIADDQKRRAFAGCGRKRRQIARGARPPLANRAGCRGRAPRPASPDRGRRRSGRRAPPPPMRGPYRRRRSSADRPAPDQSMAARLLGVMRRDQRQPRGLVAERQRQSGLGRAAERRGDARHHQTATPASRRCSSSSPPRPKMKGSPPLSRTTLRPARAASTRRRLISSWPMPGCAAPLADEHLLGVAPRAVENLRRDQFVVEHNVGALQSMQRAQVSGDRDRPDPLRPDNTMPGASAADCARASIARRAPPPPRARGRPATAAPIGPSMTRSQK